MTSGASLSLLKKNDKLNPAGNTRIARYFPYMWRQTSCLGENVAKEEIVMLQTKIKGEAARKIKAYAAQKKISANSAAVELIYRGLDDMEAAQSPEENNAILARLNGMERRLAATVLAMRADLDALQAEVDTDVAMLDALVKSILIHLPPPPESERDGITASAMARYDKWLKSVKFGYESDRPKVLGRIAEMLQARVGDAEVVDQ